MKKFIHHDIPAIEQVNSEGTRYYKTPTGEKYPSVTSVVGLHKAKAIEEWRLKVGPEEANKISAKASKRGTAIHSLCENYLLGNTIAPSMFHVEMFNTIKPHLDRIDNIHCLEQRLFSHHLQVAGTVDCIAEYDGNLCVIDFKTSARVKEPDEITDYYMQCAAYCVAFEELTGIGIPKILIIMGVDDNNSLIFKASRNEWIPHFKTLRENFSAINGF